MSFVTDPIERDEQALIDREDEVIREQRWAEFVATARRFAQHDWFYALDDTAKAYLARDRDVYGPGRFAWHVQQFAESEGWPAVLSAIARAMRESES